MIPLRNRKNQSREMIQQAMIQQVMIQQMMIQQAVTLALAQLAASVWPVDIVTTASVSMTIRIWTEFQTNKTTAHKMPMQTKQIPTKMALGMLVTQHHMAL